MARPCAAAALLRAAGLRAAGRVAIDFGRAALRDFQRGTQPHYEKANTLNGLLYSYEAGLVVNEVLSGVNYLDDALMHWGTPPPTAARVRHLQSKARERRVV